MIVPVFHRVLIALILFVGISTDAATTLRVEKFVISGGGGSSTNSRFGVTGTIGQKEGDKKLTNGRFTVEPGFWNVVGLVQIPNSPLLQLEQDASGICIRWNSSSSAFILETSNSVGPNAVWSQAVGLIIQDGANRRYKVASAPGTKFYRLRLR